jgi:hypothetical protein
MIQDAVRGGRRLRGRNRRGRPPAVASPPRSSRRLAARVEDALLWPLAFSGSVVFVEPSPYEALFFVTAADFVLTGGLAVYPSTVVLLLRTVAVFNLGGLFSLMPFLDDATAVTFVAVSAYLGVTSLFRATQAARTGDLTQARFGRRAEANRHPPGNGPPS